jgi:hypothetical protein
MISQNYRRLCEVSDNPYVGRVTKRFLAIGVTVMLGVLSGCGSADPRSVSLGTYVSQLCEAIGPFEVDAQKFGKVISRYNLRLKSRSSKQNTMNALTTVIADSRHVVTTMQAVGTPDIHNGRALAAAMLQTFDEIVESDAAWRSELSTGVWTWPTTSRVKRERVRMSLEALLRIGRQFETLPNSPESRNAMARSPVCREVFGA